MADITLVNEWAPDTPGLGGETRNVPGAGVGNVLVAWVVVSSLTASVNVVDNAGNAWVKAAEQTTGSGTKLAGFTTVPTSSPSSVSATASESVGVALAVSEYAGADPEAPVRGVGSASNPSSLDWPACTVAAKKGDKVVSALALGVSNRSLELQNAPVYEMVHDFRGGSRTLATARMVGVLGADAVTGADWRISSGATSSSAAITIALRPPDESGPSHPEVFVWHGPGSQESYEFEGVWDGSQVVPHYLEGWWDGATIRPIPIL